MLQFLDSFYYFLLGFCLLVALHAGREFAVVHEHHAVHLVFRRLEVQFLDALRGGVLVFLCREDIDADLVQYLRNGVILVCFSRTVRSRRSERRSAVAALESGSALELLKFVLQLADRLGFILAYAVLGCC